MRRHPIHRGQATTAPVRALLLAAAVGAAPVAATAAPPGRAAAPAAAAAAAAPPAPEPMESFLADLEKAGLTGTKIESLEQFRDVLVSAEQELVTGNAQTATTKLFGLVESPSASRFSYAPEYASAELTLGRALVKGGAYGAAERYLGRVLRRGADQPLFGAAYRAMVDVA